jgi:hypothetical protein
MPVVLSTVSLYFGFQDGNTNNSILLLYAELEFKLQFKLFNLL